jgi:anhydro-N-acetylmuramic acid kinase
MSGSSMDGLDLAYCILEESGGQWSYEIKLATCIQFDEYWIKQLAQCTQLSAKDLLLTHAAFGRWMGEKIQDFILSNQLEHKIHFISSHGHTVFHEPKLGMTFQMGDGAAIAAITHLPVITDLRNMDIALGGQGAPIVPIGEKYLWKDYSYFLNLGGIANITTRNNGTPFAFDICAANRVLNALAQELGKAYDDEGDLAKQGTIQEDLLFQLNDLDYFKKPYPKSLSNEFGTDTVLNIMRQYNISVQDKLRTMVEHIVHQIEAVVDAKEATSMLVTGGGAYHTFLISLLQEKLQAKHVQVVVPEDTLINYKEALVMAFIGALRWREEVNVLASVSGATRNSIGGALWMGE